MTELEQQIADAREEVLALDRAWSLAYGSGNPRHIQAVEAAYQLAHEHLGRLVKRRMEVKRG